MIASAPWLILGILAAIALLAPLFGADSRPGIDQPVERSLINR